MVPLASGRYRHDTISSFGEGRAVPWTQAATDRREARSCRWAGGAVLASVDVRADHPATSGSLTALARPGAKGSARRRGPVEAARATPAASGRRPVRSSQTAPPQCAGPRRPRSHEAEDSCTALCPCRPVSVSSRYGVMSGHLHKSPVIHPAQWPDRGQPAAFRRPSECTPGVRQTSARWQSGHRPSASTTAVSTMKPAAAAVASSVAAAGPPVPSATAAQPRQIRKVGR